MTSATSTQLQELYVAYFGRAADPTGLNYWQEKGTSTAAFAANMYAQAEFKNEYGSLSIESQVNQIYKNLFNRQADITGLRYWTQEIKLGNLQLAEIAVHLIWAAQNNSGSSDDKTALTNRTNAAIAYTAKIKENTSSILAYQPTSTDPWTAGSNITEGKNFLLTIDKDTAHTAADVTASVATIVATGSEADASVAKTFTLTTNTDAGASFTGGSGADSFSSSSSTFNSDDVLDGGSGSDTFSVTASAAGTVIANFKSIETVRVLNGGATNTDYALNMIGATGATELISRLSTGEVSFDNVQTLAKVTAYGTQTSSKTTAGFLNALASGSADSVDLKIDGGANTTFKVSGTSSTDEFETINIESAGSTKNTIAGLQDFGGTAVGGATAVNISGAGDLDITLAGGASAGATASASAATGAVKMIWGGNFTTLTGGSGADTFDVTAGSYLGSTAPKTITGGTGTDKVMFNEDVTSLTSNTTATPHAISGVETLEIEGKLADSGTSDLGRTVEADLLSEITKIQIDASNGDTVSGGDSGEDVTITVNDIVDEAIEIQFAASSTANNDENVSLNLKTDTGTADSISIKTLNPSSTTVTSITKLTVDRAASAANNLVETINLEIGTTDVSGGDGTTIGALDGTYTGTLNITGSGDATINAIELRDPSGSTTAVIDAGAYTGNLTLGTGFKTTAADTISLTLGSGTNSVDYSTEALTADVITATAGTADTVKIIEASTDVEMTISGVEDLEIRGAGASKVISTKNFTDVETIEIYDAANGDTTTDNVKLTNVAETQKIEIHATSATSADWDGGTVTLDSAAATATSTGATSLGVAIAGSVALEGTGTLSVDTSNLTIADGNVNASGFSFDQTLVIAGTTITGQTVDLNNLTLTGGGYSSGTTNAVLTISGTSNVDIDTLDATGLKSDLNITTLDTGSAAAITMGDTSNKITIALADAARDAVDIDGGGGTDTLVFADMATGTYRPGLTNVEKLDVDTEDAAGNTGAVTLHLGDASSVTEVQLDLDLNDLDLTVSGASSVTSYVLAGDATATSDVITLGSSGTLAVTNEAALGANAAVNLVTPDVTNLTVKQGHASDQTYFTITAAKATDITIGGTDVDTAGTQYAGAIEATTVDAGEATTLTIDASQGTRTINTLTAAKLTTLNISGDNAVSVGATGATTTLLATIAGGTTTAGITIGQAVDLTSSANVTLGQAADTITLDILTESNVTIDAGEHATSDTGVNDTLKLAGANNQGLTVIDLSSTTDQVTQINGAVNSVATTNFESFDASGFTGSQTVSVTGSDEANTIVGTANADTIVAGKGNDTITGGDGVDTLLGGAGDDTFIFTALSDLTDGSNAVEDTITGGAGTNYLQLNGGITLSGSDDFTSKASDLDTITTNAGDTGALSLTLHATIASDTGISAIDLSAETNGSRSNVIDMTNMSTTTAFSVIGTSGADTIDAEETHATTIKGGPGVDVIDLTGGTTVDIIDVTGAHGTGGTAATGNYDTVANFVVANDLLRLDASATTLSTASGSAAVVEDEGAASLATNGQAYNLAGLLTLATNAVDLVTLDTTVLANVGNLDAGGTINDGTELLKSLVASGQISASGITVDNAGDSFYILTDDGTDSYLYFVDSGADTLAVASEIQLVADFGGATLDGLGATEISIA